jgi:hypothetical protein
MEESEKHSEEFTPKGAIAFFVIMIIAFAIMWSTIYFEILSRG